MPRGVLATQPGEWGCKFRLPINEVAVVVAQSYKLVVLHIGQWGRPIQDRHYFPGVHRHACTRDLMPEETQLLAAKGALGSFDMEPFLLQDCQELLDVTDMLLQ